MAFEKYIIPENEDPKMPCHLFMALLSEFVGGKKIQDDILAVIASYLGVTLSTEEAQDIKLVISNIEAETGTLNKRSYSEDLYRVIILAEHGVWYETQAKLRARLGWSTPK